MASYPNPGGKRPDILEIREVRKLAQENTKAAFETVLAVMQSADKDATRLAAAVAVLKLAGVQFDAAVQPATPAQGGTLHALPRGTTVEDLRRAATQGKAQ